MKTVNINVVGDPHGDVPILLTDSGSSYLAAMGGGKAVFSLPDSASGGATITYAASTRFLRVIVPPSPGTWEADLPPVKPPEATEPIVLYYADTDSPLPWTKGRLSLASDCFVDASGRKVALGLSSDFRAFQRFLHGEDLTALTQQRKAAGSQGPRVFGTCVNLFPLDPRDFGDYYDGLRRYARWLAGQGEWLHFTACTDVQLLRSGFDVHGHWHACCDVLADEPNVVVCELVNEWFKNGVDPKAFSKPAKAPIVSCGSFVDGQFAPAGWGDVLDFHPSRNPDKWDVTVPQTVEEIRAHDGPRPVWIGEPMGAAAAPRGDRSTDVARFERLGVACGVFAAGGVFHSDAGCQSVLWSDVEQRCAEGFFRGIHR
ncbi:MAG TPA: hypothetical protein VN903_25795 [Polyangia bacterium]|nr:hypothetical protein [Polyangia bacterium]